MKANLRKWIEGARRWLGYRWRRFGRLPLAVLVVLLVMAVISSMAGLWGADDWWKSLLANLGTELIGAW